MTRRVSAGFCITAMIGTLVLCATSAYAQSAKSVVEKAFMQRHFSPTTETLKAIEQRVGGEDALVEAAKALRMSEKPFVGIRAGVALTHYGHRPDVREILEEDLRSTGRKGLARAYAIHVNNVQDQDARRRLADVILERAADNSAYGAYAKGLMNSDDPEIRERARKAFQ